MTTPSSSPLVADTCWVCGSRALVLVKTGNLPARLSAREFQITDSDYGRTADILRCEHCGFHQCSQMLDVLDHYVNMVDGSYEASRAERALQARALLRRLGRLSPGHRLLDVGAGSGILVEQALNMGFEAAGIEPSRDLQARANALNLNVRLGVLPHPELAGPFDIVTAVDVIEHVPAPARLIEEIAAVMSDDGIAVFVTPDRKSLAARLMGWKWWHYRIAHVGYFDPATLTRALSAAGLTVVELHRPGWYFTADYLFERAMQYVPARLRMRAPAILRRFVIPLNLRDSMMVICRKRRP